MYNNLDNHTWKGYYTLSDRTMETWEAHSLKGSYGSLSLFLQKGEYLGKKQFLTYEEQIAFLEEKKNLVIANIEYTKRKNLLIFLKAVTL